MSFQLSCGYFLTICQATADRLAEEANHEMEKLRLDEIVQMCAEYQRQHSSSPPLGALSPSTPVPREALTSPGGDGQCSTPQHNVSSPVTPSSAGRGNAFRYGSDAARFGDPLAGSSSCPRYGDVTSPRFGDVTASPVTTSLNSSPHSCLLQNRWVMAHREVLCDGGSGG